MLVTLFKHVGGVAGALLGSAVRHGHELLFRRGPDGLTDAQRRALAAECWATQAKKPSLAELAPIRHAAEERAARRRHLLTAG